MKISPLILILFVAFFLSGCKEDYDRGYTKGLNAAPEHVMEEARKKGYQEGYDAGFQEGYDAGFKKSYPGTPAVVKEPYASIFRLLVWAGLAKIVITLFLINIAVVFKGKICQVFGKAIYSATGIGAAILMIAIVPGVKEALDIFLIQIPINTLTQIFIAIASAISGFFFLNISIKFVLKDNAPVILGWCALLLSAILTLLLPLSFTLFNQVPDILSYSSSLVFCGMLIGALYYIGDSLLRGKPELHRIFAAEK